jgi:putative membrane protein
MTYGVGPDIDRRVADVGAAAGEVGAAADSAADGAGGGHWHRLSAAMLAIQPVRELIRAIPLLVALVFAGRASGGHPWSLVGVALVTARGVLMWFTTSYRITSSQLQLRRGLLRRRTLVTPLDRVRTVDVTSDVWQRAFRLAKVEIGTGTTDRRKETFAIDGVGIERAQGLRGELLHRSPVAKAGPGAAIGAAAAGGAAAGGAAVAPTATETEIVRLRPAWAAYGPFTLSGAFTALFIVGFGWRITGEANLHPDQIGVVHASSRHLESVPWWLAAVEVLVPVLVVVGLLSAAGYVLSFWHFRLTRHTGGTLHIERGLLTTRATSLEERRLRGVELSEPLLLRAVGGARCLAIATGLRVGRGSERGGTVLMPPAPESEVARVAAEVLGDESPLSCELRGHPDAARRRRYSRATAGVVILALLATLGWWAGAWPAYVIAGCLVLLPLGWLLARDRAAALGHQVDGPWLVARSGSMVRRRCILAVDGVIGVTTRQSFFQRRVGVVTLVATTAAGRQKYVVPDVGVAQAVSLTGELLPGLLAPFLVSPSQRAGVSRDSAAAHSRSLPAGS